ncbi:MAG: hypothetical protein LBB82_01265, partial [Treponema sp.]|nr:hypothetical protein [Treponema sp.]
LKRLALKLNKKPRVLFEISLTFFPFFALFAFAVKYSFFFTFFAFAVKNSKTCNHFLICGLWRGTPAYFAGVSV